jgi:hypothetical protein
MLITFDPRSLAQFQRVFDGLWEQCADFSAAPRI